MTETFIFVDVDGRAVYFIWPRLTKRFFLSGVFSSFFLWNTFTNTTSDDRRNGVTVSEQGHYNNS